MSRLVLISPREWQSRLDAAVSQPGATTRLWEEEYLHIHPSKVVEACDAPDAAVVCLGPDLPTPDALAIAAAFDRLRPELSILLVAKQTSGVWAAALRAGVRDVVSPEVSPEALDEAVRGLLDVADRRQATMAEGRGRGAEAETSRVITVLSPKGGSGKTTVATNLAVGLGRRQPGSVALVDLDLQFGDVASALQLAPEQTIADVTRAPTDFDATMLKIFLSSHHTGLFALCAPETPAEADDITSAHTSHVITLLRSQFPVVVIDTGAGIDEHSLAAVEASSDLVLVGVMDVTSVRSLRKEIDVLEQLGMTHQRRHLVLNRADTKVGMDIGDIETALGMTVDVAVPSSRLVPLSSNEGTPLLEGPPRSPVARSLTQLVSRFVDAEEPEPARQPGRRRLLGIR